MGPLLAVGLLGMLLILIALPTVMKKQRDRFRELKDTQPNQPVAEKEACTAADRRIDKLERFAKFLEPQKKEELPPSKLRMLRAGYTSKNAVRMYHAAQFILAIAFLMVGMLYAVLRSISGDSHDNTLSDADAFALRRRILHARSTGWIKRLQQRQTEIIQGFPDALDLMLVCVEAGQSLDQSIIRVGKESRVGYPALADEFDMVAQE
jgi:tight adherence protein C